MVSEVLLKALSKDTKEKLKTNQLLPMPKTSLFILDNPVAVDPPSSSTTSLPFPPQPTSLPATSESNTSLPQHTATPPLSTLENSSHSSLPTNNNQLPLSPSISSLSINIADNNDSQLQNNANNADNTNLPVIKKGNKRGALWRMMARWFLSALGRLRWLVQLLFSYFSKKHK